MIELAIWATFSVVALDTQSGAIGGAVASCVPLETTLSVYGAAPGHGALVTQSYLFEPAHPLGLARLEAGDGADEVLAAMLDPAFDAESELRQYAVVDVSGGLASFTGSGANPHASDRRASAGALVFSVQGNFLTGPDVLSRMEAAFAADACDLPERLMRALEAAGQEDGGDARCVPEASAESAMLSVEGVLSLDAAAADPVALLRERLQDWRAEHPCPIAEAPVQHDGGCAIPGRRASPGWLALLIAVLAARQRRSAS